MTSNPSRWSGKSSAASLAARFPAEARRLHISVEAVRASIKDHGANYTPEELLKVP